MSIDFFIPKCKNSLNDKLFGLCDNPSPSETPAYTDINNKSIWIAKVKNDNEYNIEFVAIDKCIKLLKSNGHQDSSCDAMLKYENNIIFIELKECNDNKNKWIRKADSQLRNTILHFNKNHIITNYTKKTAYISNNQHPNFRSSQKERMEKFKDDMNVRLKIMATIELD